MKRGRGRGRGRTDNNIDRRRKTCSQTNQIVSQEYKQRRSRLKKDDELDVASSSYILRKSASRRCQVFKSFCPARSPYARATIRCHTSLWHKHTKYMKGDIVSIIDEDTNKPFFAQIRGIITDPYFRPFAAITWLAPKNTCADVHSFFPEQFVHAFSDKKLYSFDHLSWISSRPRLPSYVCDISERKIVADNIIRILRERLQTLTKLAEEELKTVQRSPVDFFNNESS